MYAAAHMFSQYRFGALACFAFLLLANCGKDATPPIVQTVTPTGDWRGTVNSQVLSLSLIESGGNVSGTGSITNTPTGTRALTVTGTFVTTTASASIDLTLSSSAGTFTLDGVISAHFIAGDLQGSGFTGQTVILDRQ